MSLTLAKPARKIQMVDLQAQYHRLKAEIDSAMQAVVDSTAFINGPEVKLFAEELAAWLGVKHVIPCANGTDALQIALMALELPKGSEVIVPAFNYVATAEVIALLGLVPVFVDVDPEHFGIRPDLLEAAITPSTSAIMPVHLFGQCAEMERILAIAEKHKLPVVEDVAQAIGSRYQFSDGKQAVAGGMGAVGTTSFFPSKNLGCMGDGGAIFTNDDQLAATLRMIANHGQQKKYTYERVGVNSRLDTLQAGLLRVKLRHLSDFTARRQELAAWYDAQLADMPGLSIPVRAPWSTHVFHQYTLRIAEGKRDAFQAAMAEAGIPTMIYYPSPLHRQQAFAYLNPTEKPVAEALCTQVISLPMHTEMQDEQREYIVACVRNFFN